MPILKPTCQLEINVAEGAEEKQVLFGLDLQKGDLFFSLKSGNKFQLATNLLMTSQIQGFFFLGRCCVYVVNFVVPRN